MRKTQRRASIIPPLVSAGTLALLLACSDQGEMTLETASDESSDSDDDTPTSDLPYESGPDGCFDIASEVSLTQVTAYQVIGIPVMQAGAAVAPGERIADIVAGRELLLRVDVAVHEGWTPREMSARVEIERPGGANETWWTKQTVAGSSDADDPTTSFLVEIPAEQIIEGASYSVSLVECDETHATGSPGTARFPDADFADLGARRTGPIKIHIVPFQVAGFTPSTSEDVLDGFATAVRSMYPTTEVILSVGEVIADGDTVDMGEHLVRLGQQRDADSPPNDVYYYGLVSGAATRDEFCSTCPTGTSEAAGTIHVGFSVGAAFGDELSESTLVHELGHMHGRLHSPCGGPNLLDEDYPYPAGNIGVEGYDHRTGEFLPPSTSDLMGYCQPRWVSDYTYRALTEWVARWNP